MKKTLNKLIIFMLIIILCCTPKTVIATDESNGDITDSAITVESARRQIANWALKFKQEEGGKWHYLKIDLTDSVTIAKRAETYNGGYPQEDYYFDCVGCVSYIIHYSIGINYLGAQKGDSGFVTPQNNVRDTTHFELHKISTDDQPGVGDVLIATKDEGSESNHVAIYCGNGLIVDCINSRSTTINTIDSNWVDNRGCNYLKFARLKSVEGASFTEIEGGAILPIPPSNDNTGTGNGDGIVVDLDLIEDKFKYQGMPSDIQYQKEEKKVFRWLFNEVSGFADWLAGATISIVKIPIVGITSLVERGIDKAIKSTNGET